MRFQIIFLLYLLIGLTSHAQVVISLHPEESNYTINKNIYGHFAEHLGNGIYNGIYVGPKSKIPNTAGVRNDVIAALKQLKIPNLRWPGGCFADTYHWKDGIGPLSQRPSIINTNWGGAKEDNSFGTHNFLNLCEQLGAAPYISGNVGSGSVQELSDWVQYVNLKDGPMAKLRQQNGRKAPWNVLYWGIGNEAWGCGGNMTPEYYANEFRKYSTFMNGNSSMLRIASGASSADYNWTEVLMKSIPINLLGGLALHHYSVIDWNHKASATGFTDEEYMISLTQASLMDELITKHSAIMDKYDEKRKVALVVDEWGGWYDVEPGTNPAYLFQQNTMRDAMIAGVTLNIFNNHCDRVKMANLAQTVNVLQSVILTDKEKIILTPTFHVMEMFNVHQDAKLIPTNLRNNYVVGKGNAKLEAISVSASEDPGGKIHISLVNIDPHNSHLITIEGAKISGKITGRILTSKNLRDFNSSKNPTFIVPKVFSGIKEDQKNIVLEIPAFSVIVLEGSQLKN